MDQSNCVIRREVGVNKNIDNRFITGRMQMGSVCEGSRSVRDL